MKNTPFYFAVFSFLLFSSCSNPEQTDQLSASATKEEVRQTMEKVIRFSEQSNLDAAMAYFDSSGNFRSMEGGLAFTYEQFKQAGAAAFSSMKKQAFKKKWEEIYVYHPDVASYMYTASVDITLKNDSIVHIPDYACSFVLRKTGKGWKITQGHQSVSAPGPETATAKKQ